MIQDADMQEKRINIYSCSDGDFMYSEGVLPNWILKHLVKYAVELNPTAYAISSMDS